MFPYLQCNYNFIIEYYIVLDSWHDIKGNTMIIIIIIIITQIYIDWRHGSAIKRGIKMTIQKSDYRGARKINLWSYNIERTCKQFSFKSIVKHGKCW